MKKVIEQGRGKEKFNIEYMDIFHLKEPPYYKKPAPSKDAGFM